MNEELRDQLMRDIAMLLCNYQEHLALALVGFSYFDQEGNLVGCGHAFLPVEPRDHEESILRRETARKVFKLTEELAFNTYNGR